MKLETFADGEMNSVSTAKLTWLFTITYLVSYMTRINYGAVISAMEADTGYSKSLLSMAVTGSFITYGAGQVVSGLIGDRFSPKRIISVGLILTVCMNLLISICTTPYQMCAVWCVNGFAQSMMWPPLVRLMSNLASQDQYKRMSARVTYGGNFGTMVIYMVAPMLLMYFTWRSVFVFSAFCGMIMIVVWNYFMRNVTIVEPPKNVVESKRKGKIFTPQFILVMMAILLMGMLRDGVSTWMPSYILETYQWDNSAAILTGCILPVFSICSIGLASKLYIHKLNNPLYCAGVFFGIGSVAALGVYCFTGENALISVLSSALLSGSMHGINLMLVCMIPPFFRESGNVSTVSGVLNSCTYVGSAVSTYGIAVLSQNIGWNSTVLIWIGIALCGGALCAVCGKLWKIGKSNE